MTRLAAGVACGLAFVSLLLMLAWTANLPTPIDLNLIIVLGLVALVILAASVFGHAGSWRHHGDA